MYCTGANVWPEQLAAQPPSGTAPSKTPPSELHAATQVDARTVQFENGTSDTDPQAH
jgi:hypothetical protein